MNTYGYCRISTVKQNIERQERNILKYYPNAIIVREVYTGAKFQERKMLDKIIKDVKSHGGTIIFDSVSRFSRNAEEGFSAYRELYECGVNLIFLKEPHINTDTYKKSQSEQLEIVINSDNDTQELIENMFSAINKYILRLAEKQIQLAFEQSEKEVSDLRQRTREGIVTASLNGKQIGQPKGTKLITKKSIQAKEFILKHNNSFNGTWDNEKTWTKAGISKMTFYKYKNELLNRN